MRDEDRRGNSSNLLSAQGRGVLTWSQRALIARQHAIANGSRGTHAEVEARQGAQQVDAALKAPKFSKY
jgi:hypothetical protein